MAAVVAVVVGADQAVTSWALHSLAHPEHLLGPLGLELQFNRGSAFSLLEGSGWLAEALAVVTLVVVAALAWHARTTLQAVGFGLVLGGALGNLGDRWFRGHHGAVVDYVSLSHWPTFNLADACITVGVLIVAASLAWWPGRRPDEAPTRREMPPGGARTDGPAGGGAAAEPQVPEAPPLENASRAGGAGAGGAGAVGL